MNILSFGIAALIEGIALMVLVFGVRRASRQESHRRQVAYRWLTIQYAVLTFFAAVIALDPIAVVLAVPAAWYLSRIVINATEENLRDNPRTATGATSTDDSKAASAHQGDGW